MSSSAPRDLTQLLQAWAQGDRSAEKRLMARVYDELSRIAARLLSRERSDHTLEPPALVHEAYLRLVARRHTVWNDRVHFFAIATRIMRRVLVDHAKARRRAKRGAGAVKVTLRLAEQALTSGRETDVEELEDALQDLSAADPRLAKIVELRFFGGMSVKETAAALKRSQRSIARDWRLARAWLVRELTGEREDGSGRRNGSGEQDAGPSTLAGS